MSVSVFAIKCHGISVRYVVMWQWQILAGLREIALPFQAEGWSEGSVKGNAARTMIHISMFQYDPKGLTIQISKP